MALVPLLLYSIDWTRVGLKPAHDELHHFIIGADYCSHRWNISMGSRGSILLSIIRPKL